MRTAKTGPDLRLTIDEDEKDTLFKAGEFGDSNPVCASKNCVMVFIPTLRFPNKR